MCCDYASECIIRLKFQKITYESLILERALSNLLKLTVDFFAEVTEAELETIMMSRADDMNVAFAQFLSLSQLCHMNLRMPL